MRARLLVRPEDLEARCRYNKAHQEKAMEVLDPPSSAPKPSASGACSPKDAAGSQHAASSSAAP
eukprot:6214041-Alexandrium_andersonii.AAC.1